MRWAGAVTLLALGLAARAMAAEPVDRLEHFKELAQRYAEGEGVGPDMEGPLLGELFGVVDEEVIENLRSGEPFASASFIQDRLEAFSDEWGGAAFTVAVPVPATKDAPLLGLFTMTRGEPRGSLRIYGRASANPSLLAAVTHAGSLEAHAWPSSRGVVRFLASWLGAPTGRATRSLHLELWQTRAGEGAVRVWGSDDAFPGGLQVRRFAVKAGEIVVRYDLEYPGWKPGCAGETEQEDVYRQSAGAQGLALVRRRVMNAWHRELQRAVTRLFDALGAGDRRTLVDLVSDPALRARLPSGLRADPVCDERSAGAPGVVIVGATQERAESRVPWSLSWRRGARGWRLEAASAVLQ
jgi:hypothetical protein